MALPPPPALVWGFAPPDIDAALADYSEAINVLPTFPQAYNNRGVVFKDMAYYPAALDDYTLR